VPDDTAPGLSIESHEEQWAIVADGEVIAVFEDQTNAQAILELARAKADAARASGRAQSP
jgi:hypothetical protein